MNGKTNQDSLRQHAIILRSELGSDENKLADKFNGGFTYSR